MQSNEYEPCALLLNDFLNMIGVEARYRDDWRVSPDVYPLTTPALVSGHDANLACSGQRGMVGDCLGRHGE